jgi:hypothetical protein
MGRKRVPKYVRKQADEIRKGIYEKLEDIQSQDISCKKTVTFTHRSREPRRNDENIVERYVSHRIRVELQGRFSGQSEFFTVYTTHYTNSNITSIAIYFEKPRTVEIPEDWDRTTVNIVMNSSNWLVRKIIYPRNEYKMSLGDINLPDTRNISQPFLRIATYFIADLCFEQQKGILEAEKKFLYDMQFRFLKCFFYWASSESKYNGVDTSLFQGLSLELKSKIFKHLKESYFG